MGVGYTIYYIIRYRQIPLGGFLKGLLGGGGGGGSATTTTGELTSNIVGPTNTITINMPSTDTIKNIKEVQSTLGSTIATTIDSIGPTGIAIIGVLIWILKKR